MVISDINPVLCQGQVKVGNEVWSAKTVGTEVIPKNTQVTVTAIDGVKAVVTVNEKIDVKN